MRCGRWQRFVREIFSKGDFEFLQRSRGFMRRYACVTSSAKAAEVIEFGSRFIREAIAKKNPATRTVKRPVKIQNASPTAKSLPTAKPAKTPERVRPHRPTSPRAYF
jgi:hypothetical protein